MWEEKGRKRKEKNCILVQEGNGQDEMSFPSVGRKWEGNIEFFLMGGKWEGINKFFFSEKEGKRKEKIGKVSEICQKRAKNW